MHPLRVLLHILLGLLFSGFAAAAPQLEVVQLRHRPAAQVVPLLRPLVGERGSVTGAADQLFLRLEPAQREPVLRLIRAIDHPPHRLMITVLQEGDIAPSPPARGAAGEDSSGGFASGGIHARTRDASDLRQRIQALEGQPAYIVTGSRYPIPRHWVVREDGLVYYGGDVTFHRLVSGFFVTAYVHGDRVTLRVSPRLERNGALPGSSRFEESATTVEGPLGAWIELSSSSDLGWSSVGGHRYRTYSPQTHRTRVKVDLLGR